MLLPKPIQEESIRNLRKEIAFLYNKIFLGTSVKKLEDKEFITKFIDEKKILFKETSNFAFQTFKSNGFIDPKRFDYDSSIMFWYFVYFADFSIYSNFQKRYILELQKQLKSFPKLRPYYALLSDKVNALEGKAQKYGSYVLVNVKVEDSEFLDDRRKAMQLLKVQDDQSFKTKPVYLIIGVPASGKDTQAQRVADYLGLPRLDAGSTFTSIIRNKNKYWEEIQNAFSYQLPIPSGIFIEIMSEKFRDHKFQSGFVLTQQSKSIEEAEEMIGCINSLGFEIKKVFFLNLKREIAIDRAIKRLNGVFTEKEPSIEAVSQRIDNYFRIISKIVEFYKTKGILTEVNAELSVEEVSEQIYKNI